MEASEIAFGPPIFQDLQVREEPIAPDCVPRGFHLGFGRHCRDLVVFAFEVVVTRRLGDQKSAGIQKRLGRVSASTRLTHPRIAAKDAALDLT